VFAGRHDRYSLIGRALFDAFYMTVITITTVGFARFSG
jgi:hypothetical protein